jgi:acetylornithine deacetylase/succinyl-diaminopimelate desuccinylase-like protein
MQNDDVPSRTRSPSRARGLRRGLALACLVSAMNLASAGTPADPDATARDEARALLSALVAIDTSEGKGHVPEAAQLLADTFLRAGFDPADVQVVRLRDLASLVVRYRGSGRGGRPIGLLAHLDVVPARVEDWNHDPFALREQDGHFIGRGTLDVKQEVALLTETLLSMHRRGYVPDRDLVLVFTGDEETVGDTAQDLIDHHRALIDVEFMLNGDTLGGGVLDEASGKPRLYRVQGAEKASLVYRLTARGTGGHSSQPRSDNAIYAMAGALKAIEAHPFPVMWNDWTRGDLRATSETVPAPLADAMRRFADHPDDAEAAARISAESAFVGRVRTTCIATMIEGGHAPNALPQSARATVSCRVFPGMRAADVEATLKRVVGPGIEVRSDGDVVVSDASPWREDIIAAVQKALAAANPGARIAPTQSSYATDGAAFRAAGIATYGVGSTFLKESEQFAHGVDERIPVDSFYRGLVHWDVLIRTLATR